MPQRKLELSNLKNWSYLQVAEWFSSLNIPPKWVNCVLLAEINGEHLIKQFKEQKAIWFIQMDLIEYKEIRKIENGLQKYYNTMNDK